MESTARWKEDGWRTGSFSQHAPRHAESKQRRHTVQHRGMSVVPDADRQHSIQTPLSHRKAACPTHLPTRTLCICRRVVNKRCSEQAETLLQWNICRLLYQWEVLQCRIEHRVDFTCTIWLNYWNSSPLCFFCMCVPMKPPGVWWWTFRCLRRPTLHAKQIKMILVLWCFKYQTFLLLFSLKLSCSLSVLSFWRENSWLCVPFSQMSHSTEPVTIFVPLLCWVWVATATPLRFKESHLHK